MDKLEFSIVWGVPAKVIYQALTDQFEVMQYTRAAAVVEAKEGGQYKILDGRIQGTFTKLVENQEIQMKWKFNDWKHDSNVTLKLFDREDECELKITQTNIPIDVENQKLEDGWKHQLFIPLSKIRGYPIEDDD